MNVDTPRVRIGDTLNHRYRLDALIGTGGVASVFRGTHRNGNKVAVKVLHPSLCFDAETRTRFQKEGYAANAVEHPGVVQVLDDDVTSNGDVFIVMELLEGETLDDRAHRMGGRLSAREVLERAQEVLSVLAAAHAKGIIHRDIKPDNLFVTREGQLKVLDFGIARMRDGMMGNVAFTANGRLMGTPEFMPKEQALGLSDQIDARTDLWALGATMFMLFTGRPVHLAKGDRTLILAGTQPATPLRHVAPDAPVAFAEVVDRALAFEREGRFPDARAMANAIAQALPRLDAPLPPTNVAATMIDPAVRTVAAAPVGVERTAFAAPVFASPPMQPARVAAPVERTVIGGPPAGQQGFAPQAWQQAPAAVPMRSTSPIVWVVVGIVIVFLAGLAFLLLR